MQPTTRVRDATQKPSTLGRADTLCFRASFRLSARPALAANCLTCLRECRGFAAEERRFSALSLFLSVFAGKAAAETGAPRTASSTSPNILILRNSAASARAWHPPSSARGTLYGQSLETSEDRRLLPILPPLARTSVVSCARRSISPRLGHSFRSFCLSSCASAKSSRRRPRPIESPDRYPAASRGCSRTSASDKTPAKPATT